MLLFIISLVFAIVFFLLSEKLDKLQVLNVILCGISTIFAISFGVALLLVKTPFFIESDRIAAEETYNGIVLALKSDDIDSITLTSQIIEYNKEVKINQYCLSNIWIKDFTPKFWNEMETIDLEENS